MPLEITHRTTYTYEPRAGHVALRLSLYPSEFDGQTVGHWKVTIDGNEVAPLHTDGFGDRVGLWLSRDGASSLEVVAEGSESVADKSGVVKGLPRRPPPGVFLRTTKLTAADDAIRDLARSTSRNQPLDTMHAMMEAVGTRIAYAPGTTNANTSAADAIAAGSGVCQDQSHVFIASARALGIPARYVTGYLLAGEEDNELVETHAWIEAF
ncbi:MAG: transglutaminase family protein, partial [Pseudomonadota bacterium]